MSFQDLESDKIKNHLNILAKRLNKAIGFIQPPSVERPPRQSLPFSDLQSIVEKEHKKLLARKVLIERRKEEQERQMLEMVGDSIELLKINIAILSLLISVISSCLLYFHGVEARVFKKKKCLQCEFLLTCTGLKRSTCRRCSCVVLIMVVWRILYGNRTSCTLIVPSYPFLMCWIQQEREEESKRLKQQRQTEEAEQKRLANESARREEARIRKEIEEKELEEARLLLAEAEKRKGKKGKKGGADAVCLFLLQM